MPVELVLSTSSEKIRVLLRYQRVRDSNTDSWISLRIPTFWQCSGPYSNRKNQIVASHACVTGCAFRSRMPVSAGELAAHSPSPTLIIWLGSQIWTLRSERKYTDLQSIERSASPVPQFPQGLHGDHTRPLAGNDRDYSQPTSPSIFSLLACLTSRLPHLRFSPPKKLAGVQLVANINRRSCRGTLCLSDCEQ